MKKEKKRMLFTVVFLIGKTALAQHQDSTKLLQEVIVSASRYEQNTAETGRSVTVVSREEIEKMSYRNVGELLSAQEGIYVVGANQNPGSVQTLFMRGTNSNQTIVMIDGIRITDPSTVNNATDLNELSLSNVERIEIVRGAHSTLYGSSAIGGVINIITRKKGDQGFHGNVNLQGGLFSPDAKLFGGNALVSYADTSSGFYGNASLYQTMVNGMDATLDTTTIQPGMFHQRDQDGFNKTDLNVRLGIEKKKIHAWVGFRNSNQISDVDKGAYTDDDNYTVQFKRNLASGGMEYRLNDKMKIQYLGGFSSMERFAENDSSIIDFAGDYDNTYTSSTYSGKTQNHDLQFSWFNKLFRLVTGASYYSEEMNIESYYFNSAWLFESKMNFDSLKMNISTSSFYAQADVLGSGIHSKLRDFTLTLGGRFNNNSVFGNYFTYEINPKYNLSENSLLYLSYSTGYNSPSLYQLFSPEDYYGYGFTLGNSGLKPEQAQSFEIGIKQSIGKKFNFSIAAFTNKIENVIDYVYIWDKNVPTDSLSWINMLGDAYMNVGTMTNSGIELMVYSRLSDRVYLQANASMINGRLNFDPASIDLSHADGNQIQLFTNGIFLNEKKEIYGLSRRPNTARITLGFQPSKKLDLSTTLRMAGSRSDIFYDYSVYPNGGLNSMLLKNYSLVDFNLRYQPTQWLNAVLRVENIADVQYSDINGFRTRGRGFYLDLHFKF